MSQVVLEGLWKTFPNGVEAVANVNLRVAEGEFFTLLGPSGSGKSTLLRSIAGLETVDSGTISIKGRDVTRLAPRERDVAMVFQNPPLLPHLSVFENIAFGLRSRGERGKTLRSAVEDISERLGLAGVLTRKPRTLSGGQKQRVALGRALVRNPSVFLLDEPLSSLDESLRAEVRSDLIEAHRRLGATMIYVTHDQGEALVVGDRVGVMDRGRLIQIGSPRQLYESPVSRFVARFVGSPSMNVLPLAVERRDGRLGFQILGTPEPRTHFPVVGPWTRVFEPFRDRTVELGLRAEDVRVATCDAERDETWLWPGIDVVLLGIEYLGHESLATIRIGPHPLRCRLPSNFKALPESPLQIGFDPSQASWFATDSGLAIRRGSV